MFSPQILTQLIELTSNVTNAFTTALFVADPIQKTLTLKESHTLSLNLDKKARIAYGEGPIGQVAENEAPFLEEHFKSNTSVLKMYKAKEDLKSFLAVPVISDGDGLTGVLVVDSKESYGFSILTQKIVTGFAGQMAWHLSMGNDCAEATENDSFPYKELVKFSRSITDAHNPTAIAERLMRIPPSILPCDAMAVIWLDENQNTGKIIRHRGWGQNLNHWKILPGKGVVGSSIKNRIPLLSKSLGRNQPVLFREKEKIEGFKTALSVPIIFNDHLLAVLVCASKHPHELTRSDLKRLNMVGTIAAPTLFYVKEKRQWDYDKNLDPVTGIPNHRCMVEYREKIEKEVFNGRKQIFFLNIHLKNLLNLYETQGVILADQLLKQIVSLLSKVIPSPKFLFKYSDTSFLVLIMKIKEEEKDNLETKLKHVFDKTPFYVEGQSIMVEAELGVSTFPEEGTNLCELACLSWARASQNLKVAHDF